MNSPIIKDKALFLQTATKFLDSMFGRALNENCGAIEIRIFPKGQRPEQYFYSNITDAAQKCYDLCNSGIDVYFGVNPRIGNAGKKENIHYISAFHAEVDYGADGHKKEPIYKTFDEAMSAINVFKLQPSLINRSGGGLHCYWVLKKLVKKDIIGQAELESINKSFALRLGGDAGTHNIDRVLRIPGTHNFKLSGNPREVTVLVTNGPKYDFDVFKEFINIKITEKKAPTNDAVIESVESDFCTPLPDFEQEFSPHGEIENLQVSDRIKKLIINGNDGTYPSRSEADQAVITALIHKGVGESEIKKIFQDFQNGIGQKYRDHAAPGKYLTHCISKAREMSNLTEDEMADPLFISESINKDKNNKYSLSIVLFQEYMCKKYKLKYLENEKTFFEYDGKCYIECSIDALNTLCQKELEKHRNLFTKQALREYIHFSIADSFVNRNKAESDRVKYLTMQNGLFDLDSGHLTPHTNNIFTTNLLPYDYDPKAKCLLWLKYLDDVFLGDLVKIEFAQESIGYTFLKEIPKPALFFLIGTGSNGKSVFENTISNLFGDENVCNVSLNALSNEYYTSSLFNKMVNISSETPKKRFINTDIVKAAVAGDWISGRSPYKEPTKFKPYAKHFLAMNEIPSTDDASHGWSRRIYILEFPRTFSEDEMDVFLTDKLKGELAGIFNWALEGYKRLRQNQYIFSKGESMQKSKSHYINQSNNVLAFISQNIIRTTDNDRVKLKDAYDLYKSFCETEGERDVKKKTEFQQNLTSAGYVIEKSTRDNNSVCIFGVQFKNPDD